MKTLQTPIDVAAHIADLIDFHAGDDATKLTITHDTGPFLFVATSEGARFRVTVDLDDLPPRQE